MHGAGQQRRGVLAYLHGLVARPAGYGPASPARDLLTRLIQGEDDGGRLTEEELLQNCIFILNAGHETTTNLIGNTLVTLAGRGARIGAAADCPGRR